MNVWIVELGVSFSAVTLVGDSCRLVPTRTHQGFRKGTFRDGTGKRQHTKRRVGIHHA